MIVERPFGLLITWTCYGTWLPGDERGYVSNTLLPHAGWQEPQNTFGTPQRADDAYTRERARELQARAAVLLTPRQALCVAGSLVEASQARGWRILRGAVMANHTHVVVLECPDDGPAVRRALKGVSQAALSRQHGEPKRWWTAKGSNRYLHGEESIHSAAQYVAEQEGILAGIDDMRVFVASGGVYPRRPPARDG